MEIKDYRLKAREILVGKWGKAVWVCFLASLLGGSLQAYRLQIPLDKDTIRVLFNWNILPAEITQPLILLGAILGGILAISLVFGGPARLGLCRFLLKLHDRKDAAFSDLAYGFSQFKKGFVLNLLCILFVALWSLLFVIPGIIAMYDYALAAFIMTENPELPPMECLRRSKRLMYGYRLDLFRLHLSFVGWALFGLLTLGIGLLFLDPYESAAITAFYRNVAKPSIFDRQK